MKHFASFLFRIAFISMLLVNCFAKNSLLHSPVPVEETDFEVGEVSQADEEAPVEPLEEETNGGEHTHVHLGKWETRVVQVGSSSIGFVDDSGRPATGTNFLSSRGLDMRSISLPERGTSVSSLTVPLCQTKTITFSPAVTVSQVPDDWLSWFPGYTGSILQSTSAATGHDEVLRVDVSRLNAQAFDFYAKANAFLIATLTVTVTDASGASTSFSQAVSGAEDSNPKYFGMYVTGATAKITRISLRMTATAEGFAIGQLRAACPGNPVGTCGATSGLRLGMNALPTTCTVPSSRSEPFTCIRTVYRVVKRIFTATFEGAYTFSTLNTNFDTVLAVRNRTDCHELACSDDFNWRDSWVRVHLKTGAQIVVAIGSYSEAGCGPIQLSIIGYPSGGQCLPAPSGSTQYLTLNRRTSAGDTCRGPWDPSYAVCANSYPIFGARSYFFVAPTTGRYNFTAELPVGNQPIISVRNQLATRCTVVGCAERTLITNLNAGQQVHVVTGGLRNDCGALYVTARRA
mmetsp:Transcript_38497/g.62381  ORF Transcript_38497/g.62381 Transcript_38497/m.62381 type:complete len:516 (+) Transcript_38497:357-1904(+)|eukprot:CAMPEP_0184672520 /NCGR_PEP_ID=MMETSP0308-20130426/86143_1 /TAXON_ID=38269 /ORGANISM="Gloeochaete witrockiana, Strain SAG 46.84" /LENGTH=515 /DNA_ID=CAMNT_0027119857 /DNA_START=317 /DNA_END=1864 /DNA_ORIENTATION=-